MPIIVAKEVNPIEAQAIGDMFLLPDGRTVVGEVINPRAIPFVNRLVAGESIESVVADLLEVESDDRWIKMVGHWADFVFDHAIATDLREPIGVDFESELRRQKTDFDSRIKDSFDEEYASMRQWHEANR